MKGTYLITEFRDKDAVKSLGARLDALGRQWFVFCAGLFLPRIQEDGHRPMTRYNQVFGRRSPANCSARIRLRGSANVRLLNASASNSHSASDQERPFKAESSLQFLAVQ